MGCGSMLGARVSETMKGRSISVGRIRAFFVIGSVWLATQTAFRGSVERTVDSHAVTHGVATGQIGTRSAIIWSRGSDEGIMHVRLKNGGRTIGTYRTAVGADADFTGKVRVSGLDPSREYHYDVWFGPSGAEKRSKPRSRKATGRFRTPADGLEPASVVFAWSGDLAGQNVCRDAEEGFPVFQAINRMELDFFIALGDMIYADQRCEERGRFGNRQAPGDCFSTGRKALTWWRPGRRQRSISTLG